MKKYTIEEIYELVGKDDKTASVSFIPGTDSFDKYGYFVTVVFLYTQAEREKMDELVKEASEQSGYVRAKYLSGDLAPVLIKELEETGIFADDILSISYFKGKPHNTFHSDELRAIKKIEIPIKAQPKGSDYDWIYGFNKKLVDKGIGVTPKQRYLYLALKLYFEKDKLTEQERQEIFGNDNTIVNGVEWEYLKIKLMREEISAEETARLGVLLTDKKKNDQQILDKYLQQAGSGLKKLVRANIDQAVELLLKVDTFKERKLNANGKIPIYLDIDGFLHIYMRHVEEMKVNDHFEHKDNFQWAIDDVTAVMENVIKEINEEVQDHFSNNPGKRYSRYGEQSVYFEGDYYTLHIEPSGRISTFHKNKKKVAPATDLNN